MKQCALAELWPLPVTDDSCALHLSYSGGWELCGDGTGSVSNPHFLGGMGSSALYVLQLLLKWHQALHWIPARVYSSVYREIESLVKCYFQPLRRASIP